MAVTTTDHDAPSGGGGSRLGRWAATALVIAIGVFWVYVFVFADKTPPDRLDSDAFPKAAEQVCAATRQELKDAGLYGVKASSPQERADLVERADAIVADMVARLRALAQPAGEDAAVVARWLGDYDTFLADRQKWADKLHAGIDEEFRETARPSGEPYSKAVDAFAIVNDMDSCKIPDNV